VPADDLARAVRAATTEGSPIPRVVCSSAGLSTFVGEAAMADFRSERSGRLPVLLDGAMLGAEAADDRVGAACATCVAVLAAGTSRDRWLRSAVVF
jgi:hypothetical protein